MSGPRSCAHCGAAASGRFCASCGVAIAGAKCVACSEPLAPNALFCQHCGASTGAPSRVAAGIGPRGLAWLVPGVAVLALVAFVIGQRVGVGSSGAAPGEPAAPVSAGATPFAGVAAGGGRAPDISQMLPQERATRLFDRVMRYGEEGKQDSARMFAPMAIQAYEMIGAPDAHSRYDIGMISLVAGDLVVARAQADTILRKDSTHLLGLILAMKTAGLRNDHAAQSRFKARLVAASKREKVRNLPENVDHKRDIDAALSGTATRKP